MIVLNDGQAITLEELAQKICAYMDDCYECPAAGFCRHGQTGMIDWLRKVLRC